MKRLLIILLILFMCGCSNQLEIEKEKYLSMINELENIESSSTNIPCDININYEKIGDEINYWVIIDNPAIEMNNISAMVIHNMDTNDIYPNIGIFDDTVNMKPSVINETYVEGIILSGYIKYIDNFESEFRVIINYNNETIYYVESSD